MEQKPFGEVTHGRQYLLYFLSSTLRPRLPSLSLSFSLSCQGCASVAKGGDIS